MLPRKVEVVHYDPDWVLLFEQERRTILESIKPLSMIIHHIGSTSVPGISAKPIIDLLGETDDIKTVDRNADKFIEVGYMPKGEYGIEGRRFFVKRNGRGERFCHLHVFIKGSREIERHLVFRDYLRMHPQAAEFYAAVKIEAAQKFPFDIESYMEYKTPVINELEQRALEWSIDKK